MFFIDDRLMDGFAMGERGKKVGSVICADDEGEISAFDEESTVEIPLE